MRKAIRKRFWNLVLIAALAVMFWFFQLTTLAWICLILVIVPIVIGGLIWLFKGITGEYNHPIGEVEVKFSKSKDKITFTTPLTEEQKKEFTEAMKRVNDKSNNDQIKYSHE